jgi:hypothetical protein
VKLGFKGIPTPLCCNWTSDITRKDDRSEKVMLEILQNFDKNKLFVMKNVRTMKDLDLPTQNIDVENLVQNYPYMKKTKLEVLNGIKLFILIGQDNCPLILTNEVIQHDPVLSNTELEWVAHRPVSRLTTTCTALVNICCEDTED